MCARRRSQMLVCKVAKRVGSSRVRSLHPPLPPREPQRASHYLLCGFAIKSLYSGHGESNSDCSRAHFVSNMPYNCGHSWQMISLFLCMQGNAGLSSSLAVSPPLMSHQLEQGRPRRASKPPTPDWEKATRRDQPSKIVKLRTACPSRSRTAATERLPPSHNLTSLRCSMTGSLVRSLESSPSASWAKATKPTRVSRSEREPVTVVPGFRTSRARSPPAARHRLAGCCSSEPGW
jgi:hypothetical protein